LLLAGQLPPTAHHCGATTHPHVNTIPQALDTETGAVIASSSAELRPRYAKRFETPVHCELIGRLACGDTVVDRERITGLPGGAAADCMAVYTVKGGKIQRMQLLWKAAD
jgi:hypothetical protein